MLQFKHICLQPQNIFLKVLQYACKLNCDTKSCTCRKYGLECTSGCGECRGIGCTNSTVIHEDDLWQFDAKKV